MPTEFDAAARLKAACYDYYTTQQLLAKAEDEHLQLKSVVAQLRARLDEHQQAYERLDEARKHVVEEREKEAELPAGVPVAAFDAYVAEERRLLSEIAQAEDEAKLLDAECDQLERHVVQEGKSAAVMEDAMNAQVHFSTVLRSTASVGVSRIDDEHDRQAANHARKVALERELASLTQKEAKLTRALKGAQNDRARAQQLLQDRDCDAARLRRDAALSRRLFTGELEFAREQEAELQRLSTENRRLKSMIEKRRAGRPTLRDPDGADAPAPDPHRAEATAEGRTVPVVVESNDECENIERDAAAPATRQRQKTALDRAREHNVALLQQMVSTMQALRVAVEPVQGS